MCAPLRREPSKKPMKTALQSLLNRPAIKGFSLPVLLVVAVAVGLLATMVIPVTVR